MGRRGGGQVEMPQAPLEPLALPPGQEDYKRWCRHLQTATCAVTSSSVLARRRCVAPDLAAVLPSCCDTFPRWPRWRMVLDRNLVRHVVRAVPPPGLLFPELRDPPRGMRRKVREEVAKLAGAAGAGRLADAAPPAPPPAQSPVRGRGPSRPSSAPLDAVVALRTGAPGRPRDPVRRSQPCVKILVKSNRDDIRTPK